MKLVAIGAAVGLTLAATLSSLLSRFLFGLESLDPVTFLGVPLLLGAVALFAAYLPARKASRVNPVEALRSE